MERLSGEGAAMVLRAQDSTQDLDEKGCISGSAIATIGAKAQLGNDASPLLRRLTVDGGNDPALMSVLPLQRGRPAAWERPAGRGGRGWVPNVVLDPDRKRRCMAEINSIESGERFAPRLAGSIKDYARGAVEHRGVPFFTAATDEVSAASVKNACQGDPCVYRFWVSPYDGGTIITRQFVRSYMAAVQRAMGCQLAWFAAIHLKPNVAFAEHRHFHVILRGLTMRGETLKIRRAFLASGFETIGEQFLTDRLGPMTDTEIAHMSDIREANSERTHAFNLLKRAGFKAWQLQRFDNVAR